MDGGRKKDRRKVETMVRRAMEGGKEKEIEGGKEREIGRAHV